jgi:hypothetical protein
VTSPTPPPAVPAPATSPESAGTTASAGPRGRVPDPRSYLLGAHDDDAAPATHAFILASTMTLVMTLLRIPTGSSIFLTVMLLAGLLAPRYLRDTRWFWVTLFAMFMISPIVRPWLALDNHHFLHVYWLAAIAVTRFGSRPDEMLQTVARLLIGLAFAFAVMWKLIVPEFLNGSFFEYTFGTDNRLADVAIALGIHADGFHHANRAVYESWRDAGTTPTGGDLTIHSALAPVSVLLAWLTVVIEGAVAVTFLAPLRQRWRWLRDATLLVFIAATYPLAPVLGFGWLLICMGAMASQLQTRLRYGLYVAAFAALALLQERSAMLDWIRASGLGDLIRSAGALFF